MPYYENSGREGAYRKQLFVQFHVGREDAHCVCRSIEESESRSLRFRLWNPTVSCSKNQRRSNEAGSINEAFHGIVKMNYIATDLVAVVEVRGS